MTEEEKATALEELKILSSAIGRIESTVYQRQSWLFALFAGLSLAVLKSGQLISTTPFLVVSLSITLLFFIGEIIHRVPVHSAIKRSGDIEESLRPNKSYDGPVISGTLSQGATWKIVKALICRPRIFWPYIIAVALVIVVACFAP